MTLHALHKRAEWYALPDAQRTPVQRLAARTQGIITPANIISLLGAVMTLVGVWQFVGARPTLGLILVGVGRLFDVLDGHVARHTHTASPVGEGVDAFLDKVVLFGGGLLLVRHDVLPLFPVILLAIVQVIVAVLALLVRHDGTGLHPTRVGKYTMFGLWLSVGLCMIAYLQGVTTGPFSIYGLGYAGLILSTVGSAETLREYVRTIRHKHLLHR